MRTVDHNLAFLAEVDRDFAADIGLHLPQPPIGPVGMADDHARFQH